MFLGILAASFQLKLFPFSCWKNVFVFEVFSLVVFIISECFICGEPQGSLLGPVGFNLLLVETPDL